MSITSKSMSLSKEMSVEESYSKTSSSISSSVMSSKTLESVLSSTSAITGDSDSGISSLVSKMDSDLALLDSKGALSSTGLKMSSLEKSSSLMQSEDSFSSKKLESSSSVDIQESSMMMSKSSVKEEVNMSKSEAISESKSITKSESISSEISEEKPCVCVVVMDYSPRPGDSEGLTVTEGQEVEVIDSSRAHKWRVRLRKDGSEGTVPSCYLEKKAIVTPPMSPQLDPKAQATKARREKVLKELVESEEAFSRDMQYVVNNYIKEMESKTMRKELRDYKDQLFNNFKAISEFHNNILMKGIQYYADDPARLGKTFLRLERDFDMHVSYCRDEPEAQHILQDSELKEYFDNFSRKLDDEKTLSEHLKLPIQRISDYQLLLKELIKYTTRLKEDTTDLEKAHDFMQAIPQRIADLQYINSIQGYKGNLHKLGRILKHEWFEVTDNHNMRKERFLFLFKGRIFVTDHKRVGATRSIYLVKHVIKLPEVEIVDNADDDDLKVRIQSPKSGVQGYPLTLKSKTVEQKEDWLNTIQVSSGPHVEDLEDEELDQMEVEQQQKVEELYEKHETKVEVIEDFEAYEEMHTVITESVRSGSLTSLEDFHSALDDEPSLCLTASDLESGGPGRPRFTAPLRAHTCAEGIEAVLECEVCATPEVTVAWLKDNSPLATSRRVLLEADGGKHRLLIKKSECADSGLYTIIASNIHGTTSCSAPLTVSSAPGVLPPTTPDGSPMCYGPIFREKLRDTELQEGTDFRVCVIVEGEPKSQLKFYKNDEEIGVSGRVRYSKENDECYELIIDKVAKEDAAKYSCVAKSTAGQNVTAADIKVTSPIVFIKEEEDPDKTSSPDLLDNVQWGKDGKEVESSERFKVSIDEAQDTVSLMFQHVTPDDAGMYTCVASTSSGKISCSAELTVQGGLLRDPESPRLKVVSNSVDVKEGSSALLELTATGFPKPVITWSKDGEELKLGDKYKLLQEDDETYTMAIKDISEGDGGKYRAEAINDMGKDEVTYDVRVTSPPKFIKQMSDVEVAVDEDIQFEVEIQGSPEPTVSWSKDGQLLEESDRVQVLSDGQKRKLVIKKARPEDVGNYSCIIKNENGSQGGFGTVKVTSAPRFVKGLSDVIINPGEKAEFSVNITGTPSPNVKWSKNGKELTIDETHIVQRRKGDTSYTLTIKETTTEDVGEYSCEIFNEHGKDTSKATLCHKEKLGFKKGLKNIQVSEGEDIELNVSITGSPKPKIKWSKDGSDLTIDGKQVEERREEADASLTVIVHESRTEDSGSYKCSITNSEGTEVTTSEVVVKEVIKPPTFTKKLEDVSVKEGETVEFNVKFTGKPQVRWTKGDAELTIDSKHFEYRKEEADDSLTLVLHNAQPQDTGKYTCTLTNASGTASTSSNVRVTAEEKAPTFKKGLRDQSVKEDETVSFTVQFTGKPKPSAKWDKDGAELVIDNRRLELRSEEAEDSLTLVLKNATKDDSGTYRCTISNSAGTEKTTSKLQVTETEKAATIVKKLTDITTVEEENVELTVEYEGTPRPSTQWKKDGKDITIDDDHYELSTEDKSETLTINEVGKEDSGNYSCTVSNSSGSETTTSKVTVKEETSAPKFTIGLKDQNVREEQTIKFSVKFSGKPKPKAKWTRDDAELTIDGKHVQSIEEAEDSLTLIIKDTRIDDSGKYSCTITNSEGSETTSSKLTVSEATSSPEFTLKLKDRDVKEGGDVEFKVKFTGKPLPTAKWNFDNAELTIDDSHIELKSEEDGASLTLVIHGATKEDAGKYSCTVSNNHGTESSSGKLTVSAAPQFVKKLEDIEAEEGASLRLNVKFEGQPEPIAVWKKDGKSLEMDGKHVKTSIESDDSLTLVIDKLRKEDVGRYTCDITNAQGSDNTSASVTVTGKPVIKKSFGDKEVTEGESNVELIVEATGTPEPQIKWFLNGSEVSAGDESISLTSDPATGVYKLLLKKMSAATAGEFKFEASNASGKADCKGTLTLLKKPCFLKDLVDVTLCEDDTLKLETSVGGSPAPTVKWYLGKSELSSENCTLSSDGSGGHSVVIDEVSVEDSGLYVCKAKNKVGEASQKATVTVKSKKDTQAPVFITHLYDQTIVVDDAGRLEAKITGKPNPKVTWFKGEEELAEGEKVLIRSVAEDNAYTLTLKHLKMEDTAQYTCRAVNQYGDVKESAQVTIKEPVAPQIEEMEDVEVRYGQPARLKAKITGFPKPDVKWMKEDKPVKTNELYEVVSDAESKKYAVTVKAVKNDEIGQYTCVASNQAGEAKGLCNLLIKAQSPVFVKDLKDLSLELGDQFKLEAEVHGYPALEITWLKDNKAVAMDGQTTASQSGDVYRLEGTVSGVEDGGVFTCRAKNKAGEDSRKATLKIADFAPKLLEKLPSSVDLVEGEPLKLKAKFSGKPVPEMKWLKDNKPLKQSGKVNLSVSPDGTAELSIPGATHEDAGLYKLVATNEQGQCATESSVGVAFKPKSTKPFVGQLHPVDATVGKPVVLEAKVTGNPQPNVKWYKDDKELESGPHVQLTEADSKAVLTIAEAKLEDSGDYRLVAANDQGEDTSSAAVHVTVPGKKPAIAKELKAGKLLEGEEGKLQVVVSGQPLPTVAWMHNGKNVMEGQHCTPSMDENGLATLTIHDVKCEDGGMYSAIATNKLGKAVSEAPVIVVPVTKTDKEKKPSKVFEFLQSLMPQLVAEGKPCVLEAKVTTDPKPISVKWTKEGKEIPPTENVKTHQDEEGILRLSIAHVTPSDRGKYAVIVSDGCTEIKSEALLNMMPSMPGMSGNKPYFVKGLEPVKVQEGESIKLQGELPPDSGCKIKWMKDGDDVVKGDRIQILEQPNGQIALVVEAACPEDSGKYVVIATNEEGKTRSSAMVAVIGDGFKLPEVVESVKASPFIRGQPGKLTAKVDGEPRPEVKWLKDGSPVELSDRIRTRHDPDGTVSLEIQDVQPGDAGKYTLLVSNVGGETRSSANVDVIQAPLFQKSLEPVTGVVDCPAKLECVVCGDPQPDIKWTKDGSEVPDDDINIRKRHLPSGEVALVFDKCKPGDAGDYKCTATNKHGETSCAAPLKVISKDIDGQHKSAPAFVTPLTDLKVQEGDIFRMEATVSGNPIPDVRWFLDDQPLSCTDSIVPTYDGKKATLKVYRCNPRHEGVYECRVSNPQGEASSKGRVSIQSHAPPKFIERLSDMQCVSSEPMRLVCRVQGVPDPLIEWYFNRDRVDSGIKYSVLREGDKCVLTLPHPRPTDSGLYECRARNEVGRDSCNANVAVSGADTEGEPPMFLKKLKDSSVLNGMSAKLTACICGKPKPEVKWFKDGNQLSQDNRLTLEADPNGVIRLIIRGAQKTDSGNYRVSIANKFGSETCTATLSIEGEDKPKPDIIKREIPKQPTTGPPSPLAHAPYLFKMTDSMASLGWRPSIPSFPQVPYTYRLELCRIPDGQWSTYKSGIKDSSCDVRDLAPGVDYRFRVRVENRYGASEPSPYVTAHRTRLHRPLTPSEFDPKDYDLDHLKLDKYAAAPRFLRLDEDCAYAIRGHPARVEFWVYGCPQPKITWSFNNIPVEHGKYDFLEDRNGQVILFITRMGDDDVGTYTCKAVNEHGEAQRKIKLMIAETPIFTKRLDPQTAMIRKGAQFQCRAIGVPYPKIKWFKDWHPLSESSRIHIQWDQPDTCTLTLTDAILKDGGLYTCTATNIGGTAITSAMLSVEESENEYHILTYKRPPFVKPSDRPFEDFYDIGDELGRGTQGITYHVVERKTGRSLAAKVMHGTDKLKDFMTAEMDIMNQLCHPRLVRLWNAHNTPSSLTLAMDLCGGGELLPSILHHDQLTESTVAHYIKQILEGLEHMHEKNIAHLGLTIGDVLLTRLNCDNIKIGDFGLATRLHQGREFVQEYGHPEFVAPEIANKQPVTLAADLWSVGIIAYILLVGDSPFLRENDRETLKEVQKGRADFYHDGFAVLSDDARDFVTQLLQVDPSQRMDVKAALKHKWLELDSLPDICDELSSMDRLRDYYKKWRSWYSNASCRWFFRRRTLESCFTHPSRMIYPPNEEYTPPSTPDLELDRSRVKPAAFDDVTYRQRIEREAIDPRSESHYQNGPDTFLLPLRDPDFPVRIRRYLKVGQSRSPILANHLRDKHWGYSDVAVKERRKFVDVMDEEISDEKRGLSRSANLRLRHEVGTPGSGYEHIETRSQKKKRGFRGTAGTVPFFREKIRHAVVRENEEAVFQCRVTASPEAQISWFRNDGILIESSRIIISKWSDGRCSLTLRPAKAYDVGLYKCVARNSHGISVCRARLHLGSVSAKPEAPKADKCSDTEIFLTWMPPKFDGFNPTFGYALEYKEEGAESWVKLANNISHEFYLVRNLSPATTYYFHICAVNKFGWSEFSLPSEPIMTLAEASPKIELGRAERFQQDQTDSGQELLLEAMDQFKLDYGREDEPVVLEEAEPTDLYNYISEVAKGRFSLVMKVWHKKVNGTYVAKALEPGPAAQREFEILSSLQHEKIACLHSASLSRGSLFLVQEKLSGMDVLSFLSLRPVYTEEMVSGIIHQVIDALEYLHFRGICYFELQPDNVIMEDRHHPNLKLVDMGSAQYVPEEGAKVQVRGSTEYLAPEVVKGGEDVHTPADIWGVGVLTYILLSGVSPFAGDSEKETRDNVLYVRYHFDHLYKEVTPEATHFLMQLFKRTPQKRPTTEECLENKWLLPNEFMIKKREHALFLSHNLKEFSEQFHSLKASSTPSHLLNIFGKDTR